MRSSLLPSHSKTAPARNLEESVYDGFAFKDRITNNQYIYKQAINNIKFNEWTTKDLSIHKNIKNTLQIYNYTKNFEKDCLRQKYIEPYIHDASQQKQENERDVFRITMPRLGRQELHQINKQEFRRVLQEGGRVNREIIRLNTHGAKHRKIKGFQKRNRKQEIEDIDLGDNARRIEERVLNHMKCQLNTNGEYLIDVPIQIKQRQLISNPFKQKKLNKIDNKQNMDEDWKNLQFEPLSNNLFDKQISMRRSMKSYNQIINLVKSNFVNQVYMELTNNPELSNIVDQKKNNLFHIICKNGNQKMTQTILKALHPRVSLALLGNKNNMGRTPIQKARMLSNNKVIRVLQDFIHNHS